MPDVPSAQSVPLFYFIVCSASTFRYLLMSLPNRPSPTTYHLLPPLYPLIILLLYGHNHYLKLDDTIKTYVLCLADWKVSSRVQKICIVHVSTHST